MKVYQDLITAYRNVSTTLSVLDRRISTYRFLLALAAIAIGYHYFNEGNELLLIPTGLILVSFVLLIKRHKKVRWENELAKAKIGINKDEAEYLTEGKLPFDNGDEFIDSSHDYSYDLDFFGAHSLFQHLNRTGTITGKRILANSLLQILKKDEILQNQEAIGELKDSLDWRQEILALSKLRPDSEESMNNLIGWSQKKPAKLEGILYFFSLISPLIMLSCSIWYFISPNDLLGNVSLLLFLFNLAVTGTQFKAIKNELLPTTRIEQILKQYSLLYKQIEQTSFKSTKLVGLQSKLTKKDQNASTSVHQLSLLFGRLEHVQNVFAGPLLNGILLYHLHVLRGLSKWRRKYGLHIHEWLEVIGEFEKFNSLANFAYNNPQFCFPEINDMEKIQFENLGHPLIKKENSVTNTIDFQPKSFFILTGSNMSGKSTFLRTLGLNMVLAGIGAPVYATRANVFPLPVLVSMRLSDSLTDSESYFYAEVKRLKYIMDQLNDQACFVLLDEILRGTNSDDKRNGTIEVIKKMAETKVFGGIATHDLEVCNVAEQFPNTLSNKRFEVEIKNNELVFDYKLREGVCQNKSASFIMKKMGVI